MRTLTARTMFILSAVGLLVACSRTAMIQNAVEQQGGTATVSDDGKSMHVQTSEGSMDIGNNTLPSDWPTDVPTYTGAQVVYSASVNPQTGQPGQAVVLQTTDSAQNVADFYKATLKKNGWNVTGTMQGGGTSVMTATKADRSVTVAISAAGELTSITLAIENGNK